MLRIGLRGNLLVRRPVWTVCAGVLVLEGLLRRDELKGPRGEVLVRADERRRRAEERRLVRRAVGAFLVPVLQLGATQARRDVDQRSPSEPSPAPSRALPGFALRLRFGIDPSLLDRHRVPRARRPPDAVISLDDRGSRIEADERSLHVGEAIPLRAEFGSPEEGADGVEGDGVGITRDVGNRAVHVG